MTKRILLTIIVIPFLCRAESQNLIELATASDFDKHLKDNELVVVDFFATWCGPCKNLAPIVAKISQELPNVFFIKVDTDIYPQLKSKHGVGGLPTIVLFKNGNEVERKVGSMPENIFRATVKKHLGSNGTAGTTMMTPPTMPSKPVIVTTPDTTMAKPPISGTVTEVNGKKMIISEETVERVTPAARTEPVTPTPRKMKKATQTRAAQTSYPRRRTRREATYQTAPSSCPSCAAGR